MDELSWLKIGPLGNSYEQGNELSCSIKGMEFLHHLRV
jgi:hypothetical protein